MIAGLDSHGRMYLSLYQANSNSKMMELFFTHFIRLLDAKDKYWKNHTILLLDNAPYHSSKEMMAFYRQHQLPIIFTGPHSYVSNTGGSNRTAAELSSNFLLRWPPRRAWRLSHQPSQARQYVQLSPIGIAEKP
jgi:hypothetical protein